MSVAPPAPEDNNEPGSQREWSGSGAPPAPEDNNESGNQREWVRERCSLAHNPLPCRDAQYTSGGTPYCVMDCWGSQAAQLTPKAKMALLLAGGAQSEKVIREISGERRKSNGCK